MRYYLIAGEKSGDLHAANLMSELKKLDKEAHFRGWGGDKMCMQGLELVHHFRETSFMGFAEVFRNFFKIKKFLTECKRDILRYQPDVVILIDYAGFNLRIARFAKKAGFRVFYYISPKIWAWNTSRAYRIKKDVDKMFVIMHFEESFYEQFGIKVDYVGNPLFDAIRQYRPNPNFIQENGLDNRPIIALLPGSRVQEVQRMLPVMVEVAQDFPDYQFVVAGVREISADLYAYKNVKVIFDQTYDLLAHARAAIVTSGTATLETALFEVPQVVCYKMNFLTLIVGWLVLKTKYISLVNLIANKEVVKELLQWHANRKNICAELKAILTEKRHFILEDYKLIKAQIAIKESASERAAKLMWKYLHE
ncbi:MAG: lipid-A-disaccharide synthase [Cytophagales bacterium]|nr:lipid-A-disaccharide synthase [Cytophagales bacterium]MDW8385258.1 lipid-A-disaccharide synthase [Flammeovirgaceae bacterium]